MKKKFFLLLMAVCMANMLVAQQMTAEEYIAQYKDIAISEMRRTGVPAAITLAQGLHETENGNSDLVKESNNHFGIKCKSNWTAQTVSHDDDKPGECFRAYKSAEDSYRDHSDFLRSSSRYAFLFKLNPRDYKGWAKGLYRAGYATNPKYADILIKSIEMYNLEQYTLDAMNDSIYDNMQYASKQQEHNDDATNNDNDAASVITINGCKAIWAAQGTSLLAIATQNNINLSRLLDMNDLQQDGLLDKDQYIFLEKKQKQGDKDYYIVQQEETLYDVAQKNGIILQNITDYNTGITSANHLYPGTKIWLRPHDLRAASEDGTNGSGVHEKKQVVFHTVQQRESLYTISKHYGVSVNQLRQWNNLDSNQLKTGQRLIVSK